MGDDKVQSAIVATESVRHGERDSGDEAGMVAQEPLSQEAWPLRHRPR